jgi:hypothetical protein
MSGIRTPLASRYPVLDVAMQMPRSRRRPTTAVRQRTSSSRSSWSCCCISYRLLAWHAAALVEDHGSISQLFHARVFATFDPRQILQLEPTPRRSIPFWWPSSAYRLVARDAARVCFPGFTPPPLRRGAPDRAADRGPLGHRGGPGAAEPQSGAGRLAPAILTEPSYVATVYLGLWLFWRQYERPRWRGAAVVGVVFGLAFLNRVEALLFLPAIPLFQAVHHWASRPRRYGGRQLAGGWRRSWRVCPAGGTTGGMGQLRWTVRLQRAASVGGDRGQDPRRRVVRANGLRPDIHPSVVNITYLQAHPM